MKMFTPYRTISAALFTMAPFAAAAPATAAEVQIAATGPVIELTVFEQVKAAPDIATIRTGVSSQARTAVEAMAINAREMAAVIDRVKSMGIAPDDIQTTGVNLNAEYDYNRTTERNVFKGYRASNTVSVMVRDIDRVGPMLDAFVAAGATDISGPDFAIDDDTAAKDQARAAAIETAQARAMAYARGAGYSGIRLLQIGESVSGPARPMARVQAVAAVAPQSTPIQPGLVGTGISVSFTYEMTR